MASQYQPGFSPLLRLAPLHISEIPPHPDLPLSDPKSKLKPQQDYPDQPDLLPFIATLLNDGLTFLSKSELSNSFHKSSTKKAEGSIADVDVLSRSINKSAISRDVPWYSPPAPPELSSRRPSATPAPATSTSDQAAATAPTSRNLSVPTSQQPRSRSASVASTTSRPKIRRHRPASLQDEHWFTRRSIHDSRSSKLQPGTASWEQFLFGLLSSHSANEQEFTPNLFDARPVVNWDGQVRKLAEEGGLHREGIEDVQVGIWEMCHELPGILEPRCFGVLVVGGRVIPPSSSAGGSSSAGDRVTNNAAAGQYGRRWEADETAKFVVVTVPVHLQGVKASFYGSGRNFKEGATPQQKRAVLQGLYAAVEVCTLRNKKSAATSPPAPPKLQPGDGNAAADAAASPGKENNVQGVEEADEEVEWIMSTASDAKGNLPMWMQKMVMPAQLPKDVSFFMKWIKDVDEERVEKALAEFA